MPCPRENSAHARHLGNNGGRDGGNCKIELSMHDTAFHIGTLAMNIYADLRNASILEVGSQAVNGSLRENALPTTKYVGVDIEEGEGVDLVVEPGKPLPVADDSFDFVMATSVFEHDPCFWITFLEMCRTAKDGGYIYVSAPSNGVVHRYPQDNWRFYPDSGKALTQWAISQGQPVTLVESFIAEREGDMWNDFVAVFRKGRITKALPKVFLHEHVGCSNIITWKSKAIINPRDEPQDLLLLRESKARAEAAEGLLEQATKQHDALVAESAGRADELTAARELAQIRLTELESVKVRLTEAEDELRARFVECEHLHVQLAAAQAARDELKLRESELRQRQEEIEQTRAELASAQARQKELAAQVAEGAATQKALTDERDELKSRLAQAVEELALISKEHEEAEDRLKDHVEKLRRISREQGELQRRLRATENESEKREKELSLEVRTAEAQRSAAVSAAEIAEVKLTERYQELATLTNLLRQHEQSRDEAIEHLEWFGKLHDRLAKQPRWWNLMPKSWRRQRQGRHLLQTGLFNGSAYLERYQDVADARIDPLEHYLRHGMHEGRSRST